MFCFWILFISTISILSSYPSILLLLICSLALPFKLWIYSGSPNWNYCKPLTCCTLNFCLFIVTPVTFNTWQTIAWYVWWQSNSITNPQTLSVPFDNWSRRFSSQFNCIPLINSHIEFMGFITLDIYAVDLQPVLCSVRTLWVLSCWIIQCLQTDSVYAGCVTWSLSMEISASFSSYCLS